MPELQNVELTKLRESKTNPRQLFDKKGMDELIASIKETGIITPLIVRSVNNGAMEIVTGARRFRAAQEAGLTTVPVIVRQLADEEALEIQIIENLQRADIHALEESAGYLQLQKECKFTLEQLAKHVGKSPAYVQRRLKYRDLIEPIRKLFLEGKIGVAHADQAARLQPEQQKEIVPWLKRGDSARNLADEIARHFFLVLKQAPFDTTDAKLVAKAGSCVTCPKRTGFNKALFEDIKSADTCTDPACFEEKTRAFIKIQVGTHKDAILLSIASQYESSRAKHLTTWVKAGDKNCPDTKQGVVVEQVGYTYANLKQEAKLGQVLKICVNAKCKTHQSYASDSGYRRSDASKLADKKRRIELRRRALVFKELAADQFDVKERDYRAILDHAIEGLSHDHAKAVCDSMEWQPAAAKYGGKDYHGTVKKNLAKLSPEGVEQWLYLLMLAESDLWFHGGSTNKGQLLDAKAKQAGVPLAELAKQASEKKAKAAAPKKVA